MAIHSKCKYTFMSKILKLGVVKIWEPFCVVWYFEDYHHLGYIRQGLAVLAHNLLHTNNSYALVVPKAWLCFSFCPKWGPIYTDHLLEMQYTGNNCIHSIKCGTVIIDKRNIRLNGNILLIFHTGRLYWKSWDANCQ